MTKAVRLDSGDRRHPRHGGGRLFAVAIVVALLIMTVIRHFFIDVYYIPSESMQPAYEPGDRIVVSKTHHEISRGDVVVVDGEGSFAPYRPASHAWLHPFDTTLRFFALKGDDNVYIKRVIGVGGDTVECCENNRLLVNGHLVEEPYLHDQNIASGQKFKVTVPEGKLWLMGDNRAHSRDSRALLGQPGGGFIAEDSVLGEPILRLWPPDRFGDLTP